jgi:hypothetical protein
MRLYLMGVGMSLVLTVNAAAQTTRPASAPTSTPVVGTTTTAAATTQASGWQATLGRLSEALSGQDLGGLKSTIGRDVQIRSFASDAPSTPERLLTAGSRAKLIGTHAYSGVPTTLASDLANDFQAAGDIVPEQIRKDMQPADEKAAKRADETAAAWITQALAPKKDQPVGVMVFWPTDKRLPTDNSPRRAVFVLVRGQVAKDAYVVQQVTFGDPLETPR